MADDKLYGTVEGFIQFEVDSRDLSSGQTVRDATVRSVNTNELVRITIWPDFEDVDLKLGDWIAADGEVTFREANGTTYTNMSARKLAVVPGAEKREREVVKGGKKGKSF